MTDISENLQVGRDYLAARQIIADVVNPPPFMEHMSDAAMDEFERAADWAMRFLYDGPEDA